jgi:cytochrome oxidase Cu insertion factor (SCO1/SenC/PrrC family)
VLLSVSLLVKFGSGRVFTFVGMLAASVFVPYLLVLIIRRLHIGDLYKETIYLSFLPFVAVVLTGQWGLNVIVMAIAFVTLPAFYYVTRNSNVKERWIQLVIFLLPTLFTHVFGYFPFVAPRLLALVLSLLAVMLIRTLHVSRKAKAVTLVLLMLFSLPLSFLLSANLFTYLVANENHSKVKEPFSFPYTFISKEGDTLTESNLKGKNVAVFFWSSHCGNCHVELPHFSELAAQYDGDTTNVFVAAFISFNEASDSAFFEQETASDRAFIWAKALDSKQVMLDLGFNAFPHVTYINKEGNVVYNGFFSNRPWIFAYHPRKFLEL